MLSIFDHLRDLTFGTVLFRLALAFLIGLVVGLERSYKNKAAGFRTHILVCIAGAMASMIGMYLYLDMKIPADMTRIGANVVTGLSFLGVGTIIVTGSSSVKGLTTASGMWVCGIIGLAVGAGFYEGAIITTLLVLVVFTMLSAARGKIRRCPDFDIILSYIDRAALDGVMRYIKNNKLQITNIQITGHASGASPVYSAILTLHSTRGTDHDVLLHTVRSMKDVISAEELSC